MNQDPDLFPIVGRGLSEGQVSQVELPRMYMMPSEQTLKPVEPQQASHKLVAPPTRPRVAM